MKKSFGIVLVILLLGFYIESQAQKKAKEDKDVSFKRAVELIETAEYKFVADWAYPQKGRQVSLISNPNYLVVSGTKATAELPYFGAVTGGAAGYGTSGGGIKFDTEMTDFSIDKNEKKRRLTIKFKAREGTEVFSCTLTINSLSAVNLSVTGSNRPLIRYKGKIKTD